MRNLVAALFAASLVAATATPAAAEPKPVFKVDKVTAAIVNAHLVITANGAVRTGGWSVPRLHMVNFHKPEGDTEIVQFLDNPLFRYTGPLKFRILPVSTSAP